VIKKDKNPKKILFLSNGNGEDSIAGAIIAKLPGDVSVEAYPLIGFGNSYKNICPIVGPRLHIPSEGHRQAGSIAKDIKGGMLTGTFKTIKFLRSIKGSYDKIIAVGDSVTPILSVLAGIKIDIYLDVYKNSYAHKYPGIERWAIKKTCNKVYCRDEKLAASLRQAGVNAISKGNIMLDLVPFGQYDIEPLRKNKFAITLLPGSRKTAAQNFKLQTDAIRKLPKKLYPDIFVAVANGVLPDELAKVTSMKYHQAKTEAKSNIGYLSDNKLVLHLSKNIAGNLIEEADLILSQAGTLTIQALGMGKPVISFVHERDRKKRINDEKALSGDSNIIVSQNADELSEAISSLLQNKKERDRIGKIGKSRIGSTGTLEAVVADITN